MNFKLRNKQQIPKWKKNLFYLWIGTFLAGIAFSEVTPFLTNYILLLENVTTKQAIFLSGLVYSASYMIVFLVSPYWGRLSDIYGRKLMLLRCSLGMTIVTIFMGFVGNVYELIILRIFQGIFDGYTPNAQAIMLAQTPKKKLAESVNILTTGYVSGNLLGPLIGGTLADLFSIRIVFFITGFLLFVVFIISLFFVSEGKKENDSFKSKEKINSKIVIKNKKRFFLLLFATTIVQASASSVLPILTTFVKSITVNSSHVLLISGIVTSIPGLATIIFSSPLGRLADLKGTGKVLIIGTILLSIFNGLQYFIVSISFLIICRFLIGIADACTLPEIQVLLSLNIGHDIMGRVLSYNQSANALGCLIGTIVGSNVSSVIGIRSVFVYNFGSVLLIFILLLLFVPETRIFLNRKEI
ncbi:MAG: MFS transporter [Liquorilactobacillus ghanensis]|jgi:DHA1 family multidrug resistance protein-like MFS transporter|uniref:MFS transporter n=1 Tax=Liquorilactobacillus ghanensis TaxID=399370 RepID=UPI0039EC86FB